MVGRRRGRAYDHLGVHTWATGLWNPQRAAGITAMRFPDWGICHRVEDDLKLLASDRWRAARSTSAVPVGTE